MERCVESLEDLFADCGGEFGGEAEAGGGGEDQVVGEDDIETAQPTHTAEVTQQVKVRVPCKEKQGQGLLCF